ncbi:hypothetical protein PUN28_018184 [Cardiocondyla obscurior]|uniref:Uncharacterized protein n=1 Tax=Cardiocondyla obscurior TaxID=286306 RepID=A0AAW2EK07_9HYME
MRCRAVRILEQRYIPQPAESPSPGYRVACYPLSTPRDDASAVVLGSRPSAPSPRSSPHGNDDPPLNEQLHRGRSHPLPPPFAPPSPPSPPFPIFANL